MERLLHCKLRALVETGGDATVDGLCLVQKALLIWVGIGHMDDFWDGVFKTLRWRRCIAVQITIGHGCWCAHSEDCRAVSGFLKRQASIGSNDFGDFPKLTAEFNKCENCKFIISRNPLVRSQPRLPRRVSCRKRTLLAEFWQVQTPVSPLESCTVG